MQDYKQLKVWDEAHKLTLEIYSVTKRFPKEELFVLTSQMRRSSAAIPTNIAEGCGRESSKDYAHFLQIAVASAFELNYQILLARDLNYIANQDYAVLDDKIDKIRRQLANLIRKVRASEQTV